MARTFTSAYNQTINKVSAEETSRILLQIDHDDLAAPIRVVNDREDLTHQGNVYQRFAFKFAFPTDPENGLPEAQLEIDNVGRELMDWVETADWNKPTTVTITMVRRSDPDTVEYQQTLNLSDIKANQFTVSGRLGFEDLLGAPALRVNYTPSTAAGLF